MFVLLPWALLPWHEGHLFWLLAIALSLTGAAICAADLCRPYASSVVVLGLGAFLATGTPLMMFGQPGGVAIGTCGVALWCLLKQRYLRVGVVLFAFSLVVKPQIGGLLLLSLLANPKYRRRAGQILLTTVALAAPGLIWATLNPASRHWFSSLTTNVADIARNGNDAMNGEAIFYTQLQALFSLYSKSRLQYNLAAWIVVGGLCAALFYAIRAGAPSLERDLSVLATIAPLTLLPIYHRSYDVRLILLSFPAIAISMQRRPFKAVAASIAIALLTVVTSPTYTHFLQLHRLAMWNRAHPLPTLLLTRATPILLLLLTVLLVDGVFHTGRGDLAASPHSDEDTLSLHTASKIVKSLAPSAVQQ
jgi:hypothetical protein